MAYWILLYALTFFINVGITLFVIKLGFASWNEYKLVAKLFESFKPLQECSDSVMKNAAEIGDLMGANKARLYLIAILCLVIMGVIVIQYITLVLLPKCHTDTRDPIKII